MPLLLAAKYPRIHSVLAGGHERSWFTKDLDLGLQKHDGRNYTVLRAINQVTTMHTLAFFHLASKHPQVAFMHVYPGWVDTGYHFTLLGSLGLAGTALAHVLDPIRRCIAISCEESGRQQAHYATSTRFPSRAMIQRAQYNVEDVAKSHARCSGVYLLLEDGRSVTETQFIKQLEVEGWPEKTWAFIQDVFASISGI